MAEKKKKTPLDKKTKRSTFAEKPDAVITNDEKVAFPLVCLGASAGGLKAIERFLTNLPEKSGMSFVVITHTDPNHISMLPDILGKKTRIPIRIIEDDVVPKQNTLYLSPSNKDIVMERGRFRLKNRERRDGLHMPIDLFLESLAKEFGEYAGCAILSGTGTDGTHGLRLIKEAGGVSAAEVRSSAGHYGMPQSAIETGLVDFVLEPDRMAKQLIEYFKHPATLQETLKGCEGIQDGKSLPKFLKKILHLLATRTHHDFSQYKKSTLIRRIERRMTVTRSDSAEQYLDYLHSHAEESEALFQDILIGVTEFFRDAETFTYLKETVLPDIFPRLDDGDTLRTWVAGCATGEEVYSVAMVLQEYMDAHESGCGIKIFGTDIDKNAVEKAREGIYLPNITARVSTERLKRFFTQEGKRYRVKKEIREPVVFAVQDILRDPPFTKLDLLFCRNLLIYLEAKAQKKLIPLFHYSLKPGGALVLGSSETIGRFGQYFRPLDTKHIYLKKEAPPLAYPNVELPTGGRTPQEALRLEHPVSGGGKPQEPLNLAQTIDRLLLEKHTPPCVIVDANGRLLHVHGRTGK
ncbi:MAG: CheR family methyltransferase, partial [Deltaproteobacteria bacterium]